MKAFLGAALSEDGQPSFSRLASFIIVLASLVWVTIIVLHNHVIPDLGGIALIIGVPYGINRAGSAIESLKGNPARTTVTTESSTVSTTRRGGAEPTIQEQP